MIYYRDILVAVCTGIGATLLTDLWNKLLKWIFNIQSLNFCFLGRWIMYMPTGIFRHQHIRTTPPKSHECFMGWLVHYSIGIGLAIFFLLLASAAWLNLRHRYCRISAFCPSTCARHGHGILQNACTGTSQNKEFIYAYNIWSGTMVVGLSAEICVS